MKSGPSYEPTGSTEGTCPIIIVLEVCTYIVSLEDLLSYPLAETCIRTVCISFTLSDERAGIQSQSQSQILFTLWYTKYTAREPHSKILIKANYPIHCLNK